MTGSALAYPLGVTDPPPSRRERAALADLLAERGPDAPTLCEGWTTRDLAAHLVARDRRPDSLPGLGVPLLAGWTERVRRGVRDRHDWAGLVRRVREGGPVWSPTGNPVVEAAANTLEMYVHHEDVRRAAPGTGPRKLPTDLDDALWSRLRSGARLMVRRAPTGVTLVAPGRAEVRARGGVPMVRLHGSPGELALYLTGRQAVADVTAEGDPDAVRALAAAPLAI